MMTHEQLLSEYQLGDITLSSRISMASMTRARATNEDMRPTDLHARYYSQRAGAGLILTESVWVSKQAIGFLNLPGIYSNQQIEGWRMVTDAVHRKQGRIFIQLVHSGSVSHPHYLEGQLPFGPSAINPMEKVYLPSGFIDTVTPQAFTLDGIQQLIADFRQAALNAKAAGFDGIELHAQIFTLIPQFLSAATNNRTDQYGGGIENRSRLLFEILDVLIDVFPGQKVGVKFTPAAFNNGIIRPDIYTLPTFEYILSKMNEIDLAFIEIVAPRQSLMQTPIEVWENNYFDWFRARYKGTLMANMGFTADSAERIITKGTADIVSFGTPFIANPDLVERFRNDWPLAEADSQMFYNGNEKGYVDYPPYAMH